MTVLFVRSLNIVSFFKMKTIDSIVGVAQVIEVLQYILMTYRIGFI